MYILESVPHYTHVYYTISGDGTSKILFTCKAERIYLVTKH